MKNKNINNSNLLYTKVFNLLIIKRLLHPKDFGITKFRDSSIVFEGIINKTPDGITLLKSSPLSISNLLSVIQRLHNRGHYHLLHLKLKLILFLRAHE